MKGVSHYIVTGLACLGLGTCGLTTQKVAADGVTQLHKKTKVTQATRGKNVPDFELMGVDGKTYRLSDYKGKKIYLKFWASWCSICLSTLQDTDDLAKAEKGTDYVVLTVVSPKQKGEQSVTDFKKWYKTLDYKHTPVLLDPSGELLKTYGVRAYPTSAFIQTNGKLAELHPGFLDKSGIEDKLNQMK